MQWYRRIFGGLYVALTLSAAYAALAILELALPVWVCLGALLLAVALQYAAAEIPARGKARFVPLIGAAIVGCGAAWLLTGNWVFALLLLPASLRAGAVARALDDAAGTLQTVLGIVLFAVLYGFAVYYTGQKQAPEWAQLLSVLGGLGIPLVGMVLVAANQGMLVNEAAQGRSSNKRPVGMYRASLGWVAALFLVAVGINAREAFANAARAVRNWLAAAALVFLEWLERVLFSGGRTEEKGPDVTPLPNVVQPDDAGGNIGRILMIVVLVVAAILLATVIGLALYHLYKAIRDMLRSRKQETTDYEEETENLLDIGASARKVAGNVRDFLKKLSLPERWSALDARQKVRYAYRRFFRLRAGARPGIAAQTVREALATEHAVDAALRERFAEAYDRARYSQQEMTEADVEVAQALRATSFGAEK